MNKKFAISNGHLIGCDDTNLGSIILISNSRIEKIISDSSKIPIDYEIIDVNGSIICPGFIDIHCNGGGGALAMDGKPSSIDKMAIAHASYGTTSFLPTIVTFTEQEQIDAIKSIVKYSQEDSTGASVVGIHMEGPFINPKKGGTHRKEYLYSPSIEKFKKYFDAANGLLKLVTLSPELEGVDKLIRYMCDNRIIVSLGHTDASYEESEEAIKNGASMGTHVFNTMPSISARTPGIVTSLLTNDKAYVALITDGVHVHKGNIKLIFKTKDIDKIILVTDASPASASNLTSWNFKLGDNTFEIQIKGFTGYLGENIAGTALTMLSALNIAIQLTGFPIEKLWKTTSHNIANALSLNTKGIISEGKDADIVVLTPSYPHEVNMTIVGGKIVYNNM